MKLADRIVTNLPLQRLWTDAEELKGSRLAPASKTDIVGLLRKTTVFFVVADVGHKLRWIDTAARFSFWEDEAMMHLADNSAPLELAALPAGFAYVASIWSGTDTAPIVLLEKFH
jgi:hypothetical protein